MRLLVSERIHLSKKQNNTFVFLPPNLKESHLEGVQVTHFRDQCYLQEGRLLTHFPAGSWMSCYYGGKNTEPSGEENVSRKLDHKG
jgi:hypothetical protein